MADTKYIFVTGGVSSSLGKGIIAASLAKLLQSRGYRVTIQKFDPYLNVDPGTLNPYEHGECYVTEDGAETDLDLGHYERFLNVNMSQANNVTTGQVYLNVIERERSGGYHGKTVQIIPHITNEIKERIQLLEKKKEYDIIITEIGGTVGDIESFPFIEAVRQMKWELGDYNSLVIHLTLIPYLAAAKELKTKPTQHSVKTLMESGVSADILVCRTEHELNEELRDKLALFCNVKREEVIQSIDASVIYEVPQNMLDEGLDRVTLKKLKLPQKKEPDLSKWNQFIDRLKHPKEEVTIGLVGKYVELQDSYKSILESLVQAGAANEVKVNVHSFQSETIEQVNAQKIHELDGIIVPSGFGTRGMDGKIEAVRYAREHNVPFFGISMGMQLAIIEFARNVAGLKKAHSIEMNPKTEYPVVVAVSASADGDVGHMRLGAFGCKLQEDSLSAKIYQRTVISERHRHRHQYNNAFRAQLEEAGLKTAGINPETDTVEVIEIADHPWFIGVQFHPEYKSTVDNPHPLFVDFIRAAKEKAKQKKA